MSQKETRGGIDGKSGSKESNYESIVIIQGRDHTMWTRVVTAEGGSGWVPGMF